MRAIESLICKRLVAAMMSSISAQIKSWTVSDNLWSKVEPLIPVRKREAGRKFQRKAGGGRKPMSSRQVFSAIVYVLRTGVQWKALPREFGSASAVHQYFQNWYRAGFSRNCGRLGWQSMTGCTALPGSGSRPMEPWEKRRSLPNVLVVTQPTGEKKGRKRSLLVDARGLPLSIAVSGANLHDSKLLDRTLAQVVLPRPEVTGWKNYQYLCLDAGYVGYPVSKIARKHNTILALNHAPKSGSSSIATRTPNPADGSWNGPTPGSIDIASCWSASKRPRPATWLCYNSPPP